LRRRALEIVTAATSRNVSAGHALALSFPPAGARGLTNLFAFVEEWLRDLAAVATGADALNPDAHETLERRIREAGLAPFDVARAFDSVQRARELALANVNPQLVVSGLVRDLRATLRGRAPSGAVA